MMIVLCLKHRGDADYYLGAPFDKVQAFDPEKVDEAKNGTTSSSSSR